MTKDSLQQEIEDLRITLSGISPALGLYKNLSAKKKELEKKLEELRHEQNAN